MSQRETLKDAKRIVIKIGTRVVTGTGPGLDDDFIDNLARQVARLCERGCQVVLVTSGAVHLGRRALNYRKSNEDISMRQAAAAVGQPELMRSYMEAFRAHGLLTAQMLLTQDDMQDRHRYVHLSNTLETLLTRHVVPIINENDSVSVEGVTFVENDILAAMIAAKARADVLVFLSDEEGLFTCNPRTNDSAKLVPQVLPEDDVTRFAEGAGGPESRGGMLKKCEAARMAADCGIPAVMVDGRIPNMVLQVLDGDAVGTVFISRESLPGRKLWIATAARPNGVLVVDDGARAALLRPDGSSLLPIGVTEVRGDFSVGDLVQVQDTGGREIARGIVNYGSADVDAIRGHHTREILSLLGHVGHVEVIHRDNMVVATNGRPGSCS